jgi:hypothetical protein
MPPDARLWIFAAERRLTAGEQQALLGSVDGFLEGWAAHGVPLAAARELRYEQFLLVAVDESKTGASGCSIDAMTRVLAGLEQGLGVELVNHGPVLYRDGERIRRADRAAFADRVRRGEASPDTIVFNNTLSRVGELGTKWEVPARESWHARAFFAPAARSRPRPVGLGPSGLGPRAARPDKP